MLGITNLLAHVIFETKKMKDEKKLEALRHSLQVLLHFEVTQHKQYFFAAVNYKILWENNENPSKQKGIGSLSQTLLQIVFP